MMMVAPRHGGHLHDHLAALSEDGRLKPVPGLAPGGSRLYVSSGSASGTSGGYSSPLFTSTTLGMGARGMGEDLNLSVPACFCKLYGHHCKSTPTYVLPAGRAASFPERSLACPDGPFSTPTYDYRRRLRKKGRIIRYGSLHRHYPRALLMAYISWLVRRPFS